MALTTLKTAPLTPMPRASVMIATRAKPRDLARLRTANLTSWARVSMAQTYARGRRAVSRDSRLPQWINI